MAVFDKHFTPEEANALLPFVRERISDMRQIAEDLAARREQLQALALANSTGGAFEEYEQRAAEFVSVLNELRSRGPLVKDLRNGLVDFPAWRDGEEILLCWKIDEPEVIAWHDLDSGFAGRQPL